MEEAALFGFSVYLFHLTSFEWWWFPVLILAPDIGIAGYLFNTKIGTITYNITHHKGLAVGLICAGWYFSNEWTVLIGIIMFAHSNLDRVLGYGLKYPDHFRHTHLGWLNPEKDKSQ